MLVTEEVKKWVLESLLGLGSWLWMGFQRLLISPGNCEPKRSMCRHFQEKDPELSDSQRGKK